MADSRLEDPSDAADAPQQLVYRRAPKIAPFMVTGAVLGFVVACFWVPLQGPIGGYSQTQTLGFVAALCAIVGLTIGAVVWLVIDRRSKASTETMYARRTDDPSAADVAMTEDDYSEWALFQQRERANEAYRARKAETKAAAKPKKRTKRK